MEKFVKQSMRNTQRILTDVKEFVAEIHTGTSEKPSEENLKEPLEDFFNGIAGFLTESLKKILGNL